MLASKLAILASDHVGFGSFSVSFGSCWLQISRGLEGVGFVVFIFVSGRLFLSCVSEMDAVGALEFVMGGGFTFSTVAPPAANDPPGGVAHVSLDPMQL